MDALDHRQPLRKSQLIYLQDLAEITDEQLELPTPCAEWNVRDLIRHTVEVQYIDVAGFRGETYDPASDPDRDIDPRLRYKAAAERAWETSQQEFVLNHPVSFAGTEQPGWVVVSFHFVDALAHVWDLRKSIGTPATLDPDLVAEGLKVTRLLPQDGSAHGPGKPFGSIVPLPDDASDQDRLLSLLGRDPQWTSPAL